MRRKVQQQVPTLARRSFIQKSSVALMALAGSGIPGISWTAHDNTLHIRNYMDLVSLDPVSSLSGAESLILGAINQALLQFASDSNWDTRLDAAEWFEQRDATHYDFRLKPGQMFSHGFGEMTADDVKFSFERVIDPAMSSINLPDMGPLERVDVHDRYSGTFVLRSPYSAFIPIAIAGRTGSIVSRQAVTDLGGRFTTNPPCGSGPYTLKSWKAQRKTVLERNPMWTGEEAAFAEIHVYAMGDEKAGEMAFEAGQLDCAQISVETVGPFKRNPPENSTIRVLPSGRNYWLGMNPENPALTDIRTRQAIQYAVDLEAVLEAAWFGLAKASTGPIPEGMIGHRANAIIPSQGDPDRARALLQEAGVSLPLRLRLDVSNIARTLTTAQVIQWSLKKVGIEIDIRSHEPSTFMTLGREDLGDQWQNLQLFLNDFIGSADPYYSMTWFISEQIGLWNWERFRNAEFDQLNDLALASSDDAERDRYYQRMQDLMEESGCYRFLTNGVMPQIYRNDILPAFTPDGYALLRDFRPSSGQT